MKTQVNEKENKVKEVKVEYTAEELKPHYDHALTHFKDQVDASGFRKGNVPLNIVRQKVDKGQLDGAVINHLYPELVQKIIKEHKLVPVMNPKFQLEELDEEKGLKATIVFVERPDVKLADYKKIAKNAKGEVEKKEKEESKEEPRIETAKNINEAKQKATKGVKENAEKITGENKKDEMNEDQKMLLHIYDKVIDKSKIGLADIMLKEETARMMQNFLGQLKRLKVNVEDYTKQAGKNLEEIREDYKEQAEKNLKLEFILSEISKKEDIKVEEKEIQEVIDATPNEEQKKQLSTPQQKYYIESTLLKNKVANFLVNLAKK